MLLISTLAAALVSLPLTPPSTPPSTPPAALADTFGQDSHGSVQTLRFNMSDREGRSVEAGIWHPAGQATGLPLIVISHGNGGDFRSHEATARALAAEGFVVASLTHTGDNWRDQSQATDVKLRPQQLSDLVTHLLERWEGRSMIDPDRIGAFGFSAGGFTVLTAAGAKPDLQRMQPHCESHPDFYDCQLVATRGLPDHTSTSHGPSWAVEPRLKAIVAAAPALGFTFSPESLQALTLPVQLWRAEDDRILPSPHYVEPVRDGLAQGLSEYHLVQGAGHFDFLPPCSEQLAAQAPMICAPTPTLDRRTFQLRFNQELIRFFKRHL